MNYSLPRKVNIDGTEYRIRTDFRVILDILEMLSDPDLDNSDKCEALFDMFYIDTGFTNYKAAIEQCYEFIDMGKKNLKKSPRLVDWEQDFDYIIAPINRVLGKECREIEFDPDTGDGGLHWWTFMSAYMEIGGDCLFSQIVSMRDKLARHTKLEKYEREWYNRNRDLVTIRPRFSEKEDAFIKQLLGGE